ncbi:unnamed protein product [Alopecurus aequalis]
MSMGRLAQMLITLAVLLLYTSLQAEAATRTNITESISIQSSKLMGIKEESLFKICRPCHCCPGGRGDCPATNCCFQIHCNQPGQPLGSCIQTKIACSCDGSCV